MDSNSLRISSRARPSYRQRDSFMQLFYFLFVMLSLACGSLPPSQHSAWAAGIYTVLMIAAWWFLCHLASRVVSDRVASESLHPMDGASIISTQLSAFRWLSLAIVLLVLAGFGFGRNLTGVPLIEQSRTLQSLVLLTPGLLIVIGIWSADYSYGVRLGYAAGGMADRAKDLWRTFRYTLSWILIPVICLLMVVDLMDFSSARLQIESSFLQPIILLVVITLMVVIAVPMIIRRLFPTESLPPETRQWVTGLMNAVGMGGARALQWQTGGKIHNAMVAGFANRFRTVMVSDRLISDLPSSQMAMVILHEAAHLRRYHLPLRILSLLPTWMLGFGVTQICARSTFGVINDWSEGLGACSTILATIIVLRWVSHRCEFDADATACRLAVAASASVNQVPKTQSDAAKQLSAALIRVTHSHEPSKAASWLHPSVDARVQRLHQQFASSESADDSLVVRTIGTTGSLSQPAQIS